MRIEDYALIGDTQTAALVGTAGRSTGCACPASTRRACFAALLGDDGHGRWLLAPSRRRSAARTRRYRPGTLVLETEFETRRRRGAGRRLHADPRPHARRRAGGEGIRGRVPMHMELVAALRLRRRRAVGAPGRRAGCGPSPGPDSVELRDAGRRPVARTSARVADFTVAAGRRRAVRAALAPVARAGPADRSTPSPPSPTPTAWWQEWAAGRSSILERRPLARRRAALAHHPEGADLRARPAASSPPPPRRCPRRSAACATGTTATAGCATPRSRCTR